MTPRKWGVEPPQDEGSSSDAARPRDRNTSRGRRVGAGRGRRERHACYILVELEVELPASSIWWSVGDLNPDRLSAGEESSHWTITPRILQAGGRIRTRIGQFTRMLL